MMKSRSFMSGVGLGLIIGAALLQLMIVGESQVTLMDAPADVTLTREQLEEKAEALDLKVIESSEPLLTEEEWVQQKLEKSSNLQGDATEPPKQTEPVITPIKPSVPNEPEEKSSEHTTSDLQSPNEPIVEEVQAEIIDYKIQNGKSLTDVAVGLERVGVISNKDQFIKEASKQKINTKIQEGNYSFTKGESHESIISKIRIKSSR